MPTSSGTAVKGTGTGGAAFSSSLEKLDALISVRPWNSVTLPLTSTYSPIFTEEASRREWTNRPSEALRRPAPPLPGV